jgi:hypothetical protein
MASGYFPSANLRSAPVPLTTEALESLAPARMGRGIRLDSREYKLMLDPAKFGDAPAPTIEQLWTKVIMDIIATALDRRNNGKPRHKKRFALGPERHVVFHDTKDGFLNVNGYLLRERTSLKDGRRELTVKFRSPDIFQAAQSWIGAAGGKAEFEEDIAPLIRRTFTRSGEVRVAFARPPTMRSLFSKSVTVRIDGDLAIESLRNVTALFPGFGGALRKAGLDKETFRAPLESGERIHELVFNGALVDLGDNVEAEFDVTLWYAEEAAELMIAELSFKYSTKKGAVAGAVARRAMILFQAMQETLGDWASPERETKTSLALPASCRD